MIERHSTFQNEAGREVFLSVTETEERDVLIQMADPLSHVEHLYSRSEALELYRVLGDVLYPPRTTPAPAALKSDGVERDG